MSNDTLTRLFISIKTKLENTADLRARTNKIVRKVVKKAPFQMRNNLRHKDLNRARRNSYASQRSHYPALPKNIEDSREAIESMNQKTADGENLLLVNN